MIYEVMDETEVFENGTDVVTLEEGCRVMATAAEWSGAHGPKERMVDLHLMERGTRDWDRRITITIDLWNSIKSVSCYAIPE